MQFGKVDDPSYLKLSLPADHQDTLKVLKKNKIKKPLHIYVGCAKWNKKDLKNFYPKGTKDELAYYSSQFNSIELNATFYKAPTLDQVQTWKQKTPVNFKFFPKIPNTISHYRRLINVQTLANDFCQSVAAFEEKLGMVFLQLNDNFKPKDFERLANFIEEFPPEIPLGVEVRNAEWFHDTKATSQLYGLLEKNKRTNIIVDTAGRRDLLHMRLTSPTAFIRFVGANHKSDYARLNDWLEKIHQWHKDGLRDLYFFVHQNIEKESPLLSAYFIKKANKLFNAELKVPATLIKK